MVAVEQPRADCGHSAALTQQCGRCLRWCCPECYVPWTALACGACRAEARAASSAYTAEPAATTVRALVEPRPVVQVELGGLGPGLAERCRGGERPRGVAGPHRHRDRADVHKLAARVADLERRLQELRPGS